jgi:hypothetical protein
VSGRSRRRKERAPPPELPIFSERLTAVLEEFFAGQAPNVGRFCGFCYTPIDPTRHHCPHCQKAVTDHPPVTKVPPDVLEMFRKLRRRESLVVNSFAYLGLFSGVFIFMAVFYALFILDAGIWWYVFDIILLFVAARVLAGLIGGYIGDELGYRYARSKLIEEWQAYESGRETKRKAAAAQS